MSRSKRARAVIAAHDRAVHGGNLEAVLQNIAEDVVVLAPGMPLVESKEAFRASYEQMLQWKRDASHDLCGSVETFDVVVRIANNSLILLKWEIEHAWKRAEAWAMTIRPVRGSSARADDTGSAVGLVDRGDTDTS